MDFLTLSLPEAFFVYMGIAIQSVMRQSDLRFLPGIIVLVFGLSMLTKVARRRARLADLVFYVFASLVLMVLFWPEATLFGIGGYEQTASDVGSYAAEQDPTAEIVTAEDTGFVPGQLRGPVLMAPGFRMLLRPIMGIPLALGTAINSQAHRTFSTIMPAHWLLGTELTAQVTTAIKDWVHNCYLPALTSIQTQQQGRTREDFLPWENSALAQALAQRSVLPGAHTGIPWIAPPGASREVRCDVYLQAVELYTQGWLAEVKSPNGTPLIEVFENDLQMTPIEQARFILYREMIKAAGPAVPAPSLGGQYAALRGAGLLGDILGGLGSKKNLSGATTGALGGEFSRAIDSLTWIVGIAVFLTWWGPFILGLLEMVLISLFPLVLLWALIHSNQLQPLVMYFVALLFVSSSPLWWAIIDQAGKLAAATAPASGTFGIGAMTGVAWSTMTISLGMLIVPVAVGLVMFASFKGLGGLWRGTSI